ncbi:phage head-tail connector protein [Martelella sp. AD-3]|nr:phage head-tail connector protein [Martelella sp. AD-3]
MTVVTLDQMKAHLNVTYGRDDDLISKKIAAAQN